MYYNVESINLKSKYETEEVKEFLGKFNLKYEDVDYTVVIRENEEIIATCSKKENILKCFAINENYQGLATSHDTELVGTKDATCTEDGYTGDEVCKVCGVTVKQGEVIPALGHDYKDGKCSRCGAEEPTTPVEPGKPGDSDKPTTPEKPAEPSQPTTPATGDSSNMTALWVVLAVAGLGIIALVVLLVTKRSKKQNG